MHDPASKLLLNYNQYQRIQKKLMMKMAVMTYVAKYQKSSVIELTKSKEKDPQRASQDSKISVTGKGKS